MIIGKFKFQCLQKCIKLLPLSIRYKIYMVNAQRRFNHKMAYDMSHVYRDGAHRLLVTVLSMRLNLNVIYLFHNSDIPIFDIFRFQAYVEVLIIRLSKNN